MAWSDLFAALGLAAVLEGVLYAAAPEATKQALSEFFSLPAATRRMIGLVIAAVGCGIVWLARS